MYLIFQIASSIWVIARVSLFCCSDIKF